MGTVIDANLVIILQERPLETVTYLRKKIQLGWVTKDGG